MIALAPALLLALAAPATEPAEPAPVAKEVEKTDFYPQDANASVLVAAALAEAAGSERVAIIVFGADWCHDSRRLARELTSPAFQSEFGDRYSVTFVDVGKPQTGEGRNLDVVAQFGVRNLKSTPAMFAISPEGKRINSKKDAIGWRNADSRDHIAIFDWFRNLPRPVRR